MTHICKEFSRYFLALLALCVLASCGESDNLKTSDAGVVTACSTLSGVTCVTGRLVDDAAYNVDYECGVGGIGSVHSVTSTDGSFSCPNGSTVTFSISNPDHNGSSDRRIVLGKTVVSSTAKIPSATTPIVYFYVTPQDLVSSPATASGFSTAALNIARLLQTLSTDTTDADLPTRRVVLSDADKRKITTATVPADLDFSRPIATNLTNPEPGTFDAQIKPYLQALDPPKSSLISREDAEFSLQKGVHNTVAGIYAVPGNSILATTSDLSVDADTGAMVGSGSGKSFVGTMWSLVDRRGRMVSAGAYSYSNAAPMPIWISTDPKPMRLSTSGVIDADSGAPLWPNNGDLTNTIFDLLDEAGANTGTQVNIINGVMRREAIAGSPDVYADLFTESSNDSKLGKWSLSDGSGILISSGALTLEHMVPVATWMNPDLWKTTGTGAINFPLAITVRILNSDLDHAGQPDCTARGCKVADVRMVILKDGNIISDFSQHCGVGINPATLKYSDNQQEIPLGVVSNILNNLKDESGSPMTTMTMLAMLPNDSRYQAASPYLPYLQFASNFGGNSLLRVDASNNLQAYGVCSASMVNAWSCTAGTFAPKAGAWENGLTQMKLLKAQRSETNPQSPSAATLQLLFNSQGHMESAASTGCIP